MGRSNAVTSDEARWWEYERRGGETLRAALARRLREAIVSGALREGVRLPASRTLARELRVSRGVVSDAYGQLEIAGLPDHASPLSPGRRQQSLDRRSRDASPSSTQRRRGTT